MKIQTEVHLETLRHRLKNMRDDKHTGQRDALRRTIENVKLVGEMT